MKGMSIVNAIENEQARIFTSGNGEDFGEFLDVNEDGKKRATAVYTKGDYTILYRGTSFEPWIAAYCYDKETVTWGNGNYFDSFGEAVLYVMRMTEPNTLLWHTQKMCEREIYERELAQMCEKIRKDREQEREGNPREYHYGMRLRGCSIGCQPNGFIRREDDVTGKYWDIIVYDRPLTNEEVEHYDLEYIPY